MTSTPQSSPPVDVTGRPVELRELDLERFLRPRSVAVVGARPGNGMWDKIRVWAEAFDAAIYPVHPKREEVDGYKAYPSILEVPDDIDLAPILIPDPVQVLPECAEKGVHYAVLFAAGFAETGREGQQRQSELERIVAESGMHVLGPNTNLNAFEFFEELPGRSIALITQSGHQGRPIYQTQELGVRLSAWAPTGNEADLEFADFAGHFADDPEVGAVAAYIEGFADGRTLMLAADKCLRAGKPIVCVKVGRTSEGASMASSHTGHLAGSDAVMDSVFRQFGVTRVDDLDELQELSTMFARTDPPRGDGVVVYSISGGTSAHMADLLAEAGLRLPRLSTHTQQQLHTVIAEFLRVSNPVDSGAVPTAHPEKGKFVLETLLADEACDLLVVPITGVVGGITTTLANHLVEVSQSTDKPIFVVWGSPMGDEAEYRDILMRSQLPVFRTFTNCVRAVRSYLDYHQFRERYRSPFAKPVKGRSRGYRAASDRLAAAGGRALSEHASKQVLRAYDIPTTSDQLVGSGAEAARAASSLGLPVVLKVSSPDLLHKSDLGLVEVGLSSQKEVRQAYTRLMDRVAQHSPHAEVDGVLVSELVADGVETVIGVTQDPLFGPAVMVGLGGVFVEIFEDVTFRVPPFGRDEARRMLADLRGYPLLRGTRGRTKPDVKSLLDSIMKVQRLAVDLSHELAELDINPFVVRPHGAVALDALVVPR